MTALAAIGARESGHEQSARDVAVLVRDVGARASAEFVVHHAAEFHLRAFQPSREIIAHTFGEQAFADAGCLKLRRIDAVDSDPDNEALTEPDAGADFDRIAVEDPLDDGRDRSVEGFRGQTARCRGAFGGLGRGSGQKQNPSDARKAPDFVFLRGASNL